MLKSWNNYLLLLIKKKFRNGHTHDTGKQTIEVAKGATSDGICLHSNSFSFGIFLPILYCTQEGMERKTES